MIYKIFGILKFGTKHTFIVRLLHSSYVSAPVHTASLSAPSLVLRTSVLALWLMLLQSAQVKACNYMQARTYRQDRTTGAFAWVTM